MQTQLQIRNGKPYLTAGLIIACLQIGSFLFSLPWFHIGVWLQVEPMMVAHYLLAATGIIWLLVALQRQMITLPIRHPLWWVLIAWVAWQIVTVLFSPSPWRAWLGAANTGEGTAWWLALAAQTLLMTALWTHAWCRQWMISIAALSLLYLSLVHGIWHDENTIHENNNPWLPNPWPDYMAFMVGFMWIAFLAASKTPSPRTIFAIVAIGLVALLGSHNTTAIALFTPAICLSVLHVASPSLQRWLKPTGIWRMLACLACILPMGWYVYSFYYTHSDDLGYAGQASFLAAKDEGMGSRLVINQVAISALLHEPDRLIFGHGYGHFTDDLLKYGLVDGLATFRGEQRKPNWFLLDGTSHHSHSQPMEALLSFGITGLLLWLAMPIIMLLTLPANSFWRCAPLIVAITALSYVWFQIPHVLGFHALALAAILSHTSAAVLSRLQQSIGYVLLSACVIAMLGSAFMQWQYIRYEQYVMTNINRLTCETLTAEEIEQDLTRGGLRLHEISIKFILSAIQYGKDAPPAVASCYEKLFTVVMKSWEEPAASSLLRLLSVNMHYELFLNLPSPVFKDLRQLAYKTMETTSIQFTQYAPLRDDKITPFLMNLDSYSRGSDAVMFHVLDKVLTAAPNHRPALWLMGGLLMKDKESRDAGLEMRKASAQAHVERVFPISEKELADALSPQSPLAPTR